MVPNLLLEHEHIQAAEGVKKQQNLEAFLFLLIKFWYFWLKLHGGGPMSTLYIKLIDDIIQIVVKSFYCLKKISHNLLLFLNKKYKNYR